MRVTRTLVLAGIFLALTLAVSASASTIIYYESSDTGIMQASLLMNMAGHFDNHVAMANLAEYEQGDLGDFDHALYIGIDYEYEIPEAFFEDVKSNHHRVFWISENFDDLSIRLQSENPFGFEYADWAEGGDRNRISYKDRELERADDFSFTDVRVVGSPTVYSFIIPEGKPDYEHPHFLCGGNLCYLVENPFYYEGGDDRMYVLADLLHEFYQTGIGNERKALVRYEDLSPGLYNLQMLRDFADELESRDVPFGFGVIPIFKDPEGLYYMEPTELHLKDDPALANTFNYMLRKGGTMVMHGCTHQHDSGITGEDWEFTYDIEGVPLEDDSEQWMRDKIETSLAEFDQWGWRPMIWETPHYSASHGDYKIVAEYFDAYWERILAFPVAPDDVPVFAEALEFVSQDLPYFSSTGSFGMQILPENLGYIDKNIEHYYPEDMLEVADRLSIIRDAVPTFFFHYTLVTIEDVMTVVDGLVDRGYEFISPEDFVGDDGMEGLDGEPFGDGETGLEGGDDDDDANEPDYMADGDESDNGACSF
jgi:uncharacterized protein YdaL